MNRPVRCNTDTHLAGPNRGACTFLPGRQIETRPRLLTWFPWIQLVVRKLGCSPAREAAMTRRSGQGDASGASALRQTDHDIVLAGMGLANALAALRVGALRPELRVAGFDIRTKIGEGRTWS